MSTRREIISGILAALISIIILGGSVVVATTESRSTVAMELAPTPTFTSYPTQIILVTQRPGEPTYTPSPTVLELPSHTPTILAIAACPQPPNWFSILIYPGDTIESLAQTYNITPQELKQANCLVGDSLPAGSLLFVPGQPAPTQPPCGPPYGWVYYIVKSGDTLYRISRAFGVSVTQLKVANCLFSDMIRVGQKLHVPNVPTRVPSSTPIPPATQTPRPSATSPSIPPTATTTSQAPSATPTQTPALPTETPTDAITPTETPVIPSPTFTQTPTPSETPTLTEEPATFTPTPTETPSPEPPTSTPTEWPTPTTPPTSTPYPPTPTP